MTMGVRVGLALAAVLGVLLLFTFERPPVDTVQHGYRGTGMDQNFDPRRIAAEYRQSQLPETLPPVHGGPPAREVYQNVKVLGDLDVAAFTRLMASITTWVAPSQGCAYCHNTENMASDALYTQVVARRMIQMVQHINGDWKKHVSETGVSCYTCHRGNPVPQYISYENPGPARFTGMAETQTGQNLASPQVGTTSLPYDPFTPYLAGNSDIRVQATEALPGSDRSSIKQTEWTYGLMMHISQSLGVNCTNCHNTQSFSSWSESMPQRTTAWYGIRMVRDLNSAFIAPLASVLPNERLGPHGSAPQVNCMTCHQGVYKPLFGISPVQEFPELRGASAAQ